MSTEPQKPVAKPYAGPRLRRYFFTGLVIIAPAAITIWATLWVIDTFDGMVKPWIPEYYNPDTYLPIKLPGFGLICAFALITLVGFFAANLVGRTLLSVGWILIAGVVAERQARVDRGRVHRRRRRKHRRPALDVGGGDRTHDRGAARIATAFP